MNTKAKACRAICKRLGRQQRRKCRADGRCKAMEDKMRVLERNKYNAKYKCVSTKWPLRKWTYCPYCGAMTLSLPIKKAKKEGK